MKNKRYPIILIPFLIPFGVFMAIVFFAVFILKIAMEIAAFIFSTTSRQLDKLITEYPITVLDYVIDTKKNRTNTRV